MTEVQITHATFEQTALVHQIMQAAFAEYLGVLYPPSSAHAETADDVRAAMHKGGALLAQNIALYQRLGDEVVRVEPHPRSAPDRAEMSATLIKKRVHSRLGANFADAQLRVPTDNRFCRDALQGVRSNEQPAPKSECTPRSCTFSPPSHRVVK